MIRWEWSAFGQLDCERLYALLTARAAVFVVEQHCVYQDLDGLDVGAWHLMGWHDDDTLAAYLRVLPPGITAFALACSAALFGRAAE